MHLEVDKVEDNLSRSVSVVLNISTWSRENKGKKRKKEKEEGEEGMKKCCQFNGLYGLADCSAPRRAL